MAKPKIIPGIDCDTDATEGIRKVLRSRLREMCALRKTSLDWNDPEGVHDMRVASRRLRSALSDFMPYIRSRSLTSSLNEIRDIADVLGQVRDQDVAIMALEILATKTPSKVTSTLDQIVEEHKEIRNEAREQLKRALNKDQIQQFESDFATAIDEATSRPQRTRRGSRTPDSTRTLSYSTIGRSIIVGRLKDLEKLSDSLYQPLEVEPLHKMRIAAKRLRYSLELFEQCWGTMSMFAQRTAALQLALGELHDCDVWINSFGRRLQNQNSQKQNEASIWLLNHFMEVRAISFAGAFGCWRDWEKDAFSAQLRECLKTIKTNRATDPVKAAP